MGRPVALAGQASPYIPLQHWTAPFIEHLIQRGVIADPDPLTRPLRRTDVLTALRAVDAASLPRSVGETVTRLMAELDPHGRDPSYRVETYLGVAASTYARREALRQEGNDVVSPLIGLQVHGVFGPVVVASHGLGDRRLREDPDYTGEKTSQFPGRITDAYIALQYRYGQAFFGAIDRSWGPPGVPGLLVSDQPYSFDHFFVRVGSDHARIEALATELNSVRNASGERVRRFWAAHRVFVRPVGWLVASLSQGSLWTGVGRGFELWWLNPLKGSSLTRLDESAPDSVNSLYAGDLRVQLPRRIIVHGSVMLDDLASLFGQSAAPDRIGWTALVDVPINSAAVARGYVTGVSSLTYRSPEGLDQSVERRGVGLGRNFADYTQLTVQVSVLPAPLLVVTPEITLLRQGEGDFRMPFPPLPALDHPFLFEGTVERTWRLGVAAAAQPIRRFSVEGDAGLHFVGNAGHVAGATRTEFVGRVRLTYTFGGELRLP